MKLIDVRYDEEHKCNLTTYACESEEELNRYYVGMDELWTHVNFIKLTITFKEGVLN